MRTRPDLAPDVARDQVLEFGIKRGLGRRLLVDPRRTQHLAAHAHAACVALLVIHGGSSACSRVMPALVPAMTPIVRLSRIPAPYRCRPAAARNWRCAPPPAS